MVPGNFRLNAGDKYPMVFVAGSFKGLLLWADTSLVIPPNPNTNFLGVTAGGPQKLRIAVLDASGKVIETLHKSVGRSTDPAAPDWPRLDVKFANAAKTACVNISREDTGTETVGFCLY